MKKQSVFFLLLMAATVFISCGDDDEMIDVKDLPYTGYERGRAYVDLGLPSGLKWATCNVGAENPWECGDYFAWGETEWKYSSYTWSTYKYYNYDAPGQLTKYTGKDQKATLDAADDAAYVNWGGKWRTPTEKEVLELLDNCYWKFTRNYNHRFATGYIVYKAKNAKDKGKKEYDGGRTGGTGATVASYSITDDHIFLPVTGKYQEYSFDEAAYLGAYWTASLSDSVFKDGFSLRFDFVSLSVYRLPLCHGLTVRPVCLN